MSKKLCFVSITVFMITLIQLTSALDGGAIAAEAIEVAVGPVFLPGGVMAS